MTKRGRLEIIKDILQIIQNNRGEINITPLLRKTNLSSKQFYKYLEEIKNKNFITEKTLLQNKKILLTIRGNKFLEKYKTIINFIQEFEL